ncbi:hypothetical protein CPC08DRAFT_810046 [Agrocybe pediades]|nr:hypothetical protein CPC08DRAFT_810046 [Agrocybe pediades]
MEAELKQFKDGVREAQCELKDIQDELEDFQNRLRAFQDETEACEARSERVQGGLAERVEHFLKGVQNDLKVVNVNLELVKEGTNAEERNFKKQQMKNMEMAVGLAELADRLGVD